MSQQFITRVVNYVANEIIVKGLANSRTFQKFAVRTNKQYEELNKHGVDKIAKTVEDLAKKQAPGSSGGAANADMNANVADALQAPQRPLRGFPGFVLAFFKEVRKDFAGH